MTDSQTPAARLGRARDLAQQLHSLLSGGPQAGASRTEASVRMVATQLAQGQNLGDIDEFWVASAQSLLQAKLAERDRALQEAISALARKRIVSARARELAIAVLTAAGHPAFTDQVIASVPFGGQAATA